MKILITGALGYIGIHVCYELMREEIHELILIDNLSNSSIENFQILNRVKYFYNTDIKDENKLREIFKLHSIEVVIHFASLKSAPESITESLKYYENNVSGTITLLKIMNEFGCKKIIFSSSACVYPSVDHLHTEDEKIQISEISNPYGKTKYIIEEILKDASISYDIECVILRYFNPVGVLIHDLKLPKSISNLMDVILDSIKNKKKFYIFGKDYDTRDGTCIRDFIHIYDLTMGHIKAIEYFEYPKKNTFEVFNLGCGNGITVLELIQTFENVNNITLTYEFGNRRLKDTPISLANIKKANQLLNWYPIKTIEDMCRDLTFLKE